MVETVVFGGVVLGMVGGGQRGQLVAVDGVVEEEFLDPRCHIRRWEVAPSLTQVLVPAGRV